mmetsp:Transcript_52312/g.131385  ORF Transcript_52312/g.131385 Transcript_52312/m.131385 type:complete len:477 (-) Transcript_52312:78-1508(-)|eukprot:CAMPEP_0177651322 /NCGR_PEP_ID=MMETSP0447-20121125/12479_1 /TAXON_ID=0 /ORGANISM="Stygamoeba regulata, Strain BSH-02190019" /LENGTH=476 /DNA_ID=CAMNT_0019154381 /DNA_START=53 /DNA_END=1483 /DNA_ORIENTATION=+
MSAKADVVKSLLPALVSDDRSKMEMDDFLTLYKKFQDGNEAIEWDLIQPPSSSVLLDYSSLASKKSDTPLSAVLSRVAVLKLNGGLGTSMGCTGPKSVIELDSNTHQTFLDLTVKQIQHLNKENGSSVPLILMNSFNTHEDTMKLLSQDCYKDAKIQTFNQSRHPRLRQNEDGVWVPYPTAPDAPLDHWTPPGHGDVYSALVNSGILAKLRSEGRDWLFVSNIDNLGATLDTDIAQFAIGSNSEFIIELTEKTFADVKGGTLITYNGKPRLLEVAQVSADHLSEFKSVSKFKVFNTNNLWLNLSAVERLHNDKAFEDIDVIANKKEANGIPVLQLERAAGAFIHKFKNPVGVNVPRSRFLPVKTCNDLLLLKSNVYALTENGFLGMNPARPIKVAPEVRLGSEFKTVKDFSDRVPAIPDMAELNHLTAVGDIRFEENVTLKGTVIIVPAKGSKVTIKKGTTLENQVVRGDGDVVSI